QQRLHELDAAAVHTQDEHTLDALVVGRVLPRPAHPARSLSTVAGYHRRASPRRQQMKLGLLETTDGRPHHHSPAGEPNVAFSPSWFAAASRWTNEDGRPVTADAILKDPQGSRRARRGAAIRKWAPAVLLVVVPLLLVSLHVRAYTKLSPIDELEHIDYMFRSPGLHPVIAGTTLVEPAMREEACRGLDSVYPTPPCDTKKLSISVFQDQGYDTAYIHPPTYYDTTWAAGELVKTATGAKSWVTAWRLVGALWL